MGVASSSTCPRRAALSYADRRVGPWRTFACDLPIGSIRPKGDVRRQQSNGGERRIPFSNWSRAEALRVSTLSGACVLCALVRRLMG
jgi:hypothetical protein